MPPTTPRGRPDALLLDLDGTLHSGDEPIPGAVDAVRRLVELGVPHRFVTNTTRLSRAELAGRLRGMGFPIDAGQLFTAPVAAAAWLRRAGLRRVMLCLPQGCRTDFPDAEPTDDSPDAVVLGDLGAAWTFDLLDRAFRALDGGARLVALQKNRWWMTPAGRTLDAGPFVAALEYAADTTAVVIGKPSREFFELAAASLGVDPGRIVMVGDDIAGDVGGAQGAGMKGALVRTGKFRPRDLERSGVRPDAVADDLGALVRRWFG